jgi:tetratricopeptide (TPR) repeat protein
VIEMQRNAYLLSGLLMVATAAFAGVDEDVAQVRQEWERIKYQLPAAEQEGAFEKLVRQAEKVMGQHPSAAEAAIWHGIVEASYAGAKGGLGGLSAAKVARKSFEQALALDPNALQGSAYTSLGSLYYQVPGWPIGFGDDKKALELLKQGLALNPAGIDPNYFYADYLYRLGDYAAAEAALGKALQAPPRPGRQLADEGRRKEAQELLQKVREKKR